jgi:hypothetical protein
MKPRVDRFRNILTDVMPITRRLDVKATRTTRLRRSCETVTFDKPLNPPPPFYGLRGPCLGTDAYPFVRTDTFQRLLDTSFETIWEADPRWVRILHLLESRPVAIWLASAVGFVGRC